LGNLAVKNEVEREKRNQDVGTLLGENEGLLKKYLRFWGTSTPHRWGGKDVHRGLRKTKTEKVLKAKKNNKSRERKGGGIWGIFCLFFCLKTLTGSERTSASAPL